MKNFRKREDARDKYCSILGSIGKVFGFGNDAGGNAAAASDPFFQKAIDELRRQFDQTQANIKPFLDAGTSALPLVQEGTTVEGLNERLGRIFNTDIFNNLRDERERSVRGQLAAGGLTRSGTALEEIANIPQSIGLALEDMLTGRATNLAGSGQNAAVNLGSIGSSTSSAIANTLLGQGQNLRSGIITDAQSGAAGTQNLLNTAAALGGIFFSDPVLKDNIQPIGHIKDLTLYQWEWIEAANDTLIADCGTTGFMADEVAEKYPEYVSEYCGLAVIDYPNLLNHLEAA